MTDKVSKRSRLGAMGAAALMAMLSACSSAGPQRSPDAQPLDNPAACQAAGGQLQALGRLQRVQCVVPYADAGQVCGDSSECVGACLLQGDVEGQPGLAASGICQRDASETFGCRQQVSNGLAGAMRCVD